ncbi:hypothetical protein LAV84_20960 [Rhizobium sp. VS19-DR104.2]|uniref:hypothetical protein n=1 Tax=unclassified Rhizobium TaxID=2613769 RepID=UPI001CC378D3|nr:MULTISPECIES: hypothetical protein [unclassified Rhizobium]MBZ5762405.1 hypothetical protein [Rhizobium sp. VS19-DR96]MBZ5768444.1 hypothetical protein [Rhizobium sp. VS19-DR129.2]MBZ5776098.1 hypothetical protein [Rhizobium sp. VS19-DRK62.2]MBZ5786211.1 hypothetical protein [Rhizobium sp. VS19-DR121]MBZ5804483.1 hypothetical protein [Rhizobium sp. VS19-DR181]
MAPRFDSLTKLFDSVRDSNHDFRITTDPFPPLDAEKLGKTLEVVRKGTENGTNNKPVQASKELDDVERSIVERVEAQRDDAYQVLEDQLNTYSTRMRNLDFDGHFGQIHLVNNSSVDDFRADVAGGRDELFGRRNALKEADEELADFRKRNALEKRVARSKSGIMTVLKWCLILVLLVIETAVNGIYLAKGSDSGLVGGIGYAFGFAFVNVVGTIILSIYFIPNLAHRSIFRKLIGLLGCLLWLTIAIGLNIVMSHYREVSATAVDDVGKVVMERLTHSTFTLDDIDSWVLFAGGFLFSTIALVDGLTMSDPYPGYAGTYTRYVAAREEYVEHKIHLVDSLKDIRDDHNEKVEGIIRALSLRRKECAAIIDARTRLVRLFSEHQTQLESVGRKLIETYRDANRQTRTKPEPKYFATPYKMERRRAVVDTSDDWNDKELAERIQAAQTELSDQMKRISKEFDDAVTAYRQLDNLFPETINGPTQA